MKMMTGGGSMFISEEKVDLTELKVLLFHEDAQRSKHYLSVLRVCGLRAITVAERLSEAIKHIIAEQYDLIIVSHVGEAQGVSRLLEELKGLDATSSIPVVAILSDGSIRNALCVLAKGVDDILVEPLSRQAVESVAHKVLREHFQFDPVKERLNRAKDLMRVGDLDQARRIYLELLTQESHQLEVYLGLFEVSCQVQQWNDAEASIRKAVELAKGAGSKIEAHRDLARVFFYYGVFYEKRHQLEKAIKSYRTALSLNPYQVASIKSLLQLLQKRDEVGEIVTVLREAQSSFLPYSQQLEEIVICLEDLAQRFLDLSMPVQARRMYEQLVSLRHENGAVHLKVADFFLAYGQISLVIKTLIQVTQRLKDPDLLFKIGSILLDAEKKYLSNDRVEAPQGVDLSFFSGMDKTKVVMMAHKAFQQGLLLDPENPRIRMSIACCHLRMGELEPAVEILEKLKESYGTDTEIIAQAIETLIVERAFQIAGEWLKEATLQHPKETRFFMLYASYYRSLGQPYDAVGSLKRALAVQQDNPELLVALARLYRELDQYSDAISYYEKASKILPTDTSIQERLREVLAMKYQEVRGRK